MYTDVFKEPRGLMRVIQLLFAILAFATTAGYKSSITLDYTCKDTRTITGSLGMTISYPFNMAADSVVAPISCPNNGTTTLAPAPGLNYPFGSYTSSAQFYVFVGVMAFLYTIGITIVYVFFDQLYTDNDLVPQIDFIVTVVWTLFWFIASVAWAVGVSFLKLETFPDRLWHQISACNPIGGTAECIATKFGYGGLDVSLICGFANVFLWGANLWFLFKETIWFKRMHPELAYASEQQQQQQAPGQPQAGGGIETGAGIP